MARVFAGGRAVLFSVRTGATYEEGAHVAVLSLTTGEYHTVIEQGYHARYVPTGHIVYAVGGSLMASCLTRLHAGIRESQSVHVATLHR